MNRLSGCTHSSNLTSKTNESSIDRRVAQVNHNDGSTVGNRGDTSQARAEEKCNFGGLQTVLRNAADSLHSGNPVSYIDFADDAQFSSILKEMEAVGVSASDVQKAWAKAIREVCGEKAARITENSFGPDQTLSGLMKLLGISETDSFKRWVLIPQDNHFPTAFEGLLQSSVSSL